MPATVKAITRPPVPFLGPQKAPQNVSYGWGQRGDRPLQGDDYRLEYYEDGQVKLVSSAANPSDRKKALFRFSL
jgi:hypothetical protein